MDDFIDALPGFPDNIRYDGKGRYWIALGAVREISFIPISLCRILSYDLILGIFLPGNDREHEALAPVSDAEKNDCYLIYVGGSFPCSAQRQWRSICEWGGRTDEAIQGPEVVNDNWRAKDWKRSLLCFIGQGLSQPDIRRGRRREEVSLCGVEYSCGASELAELD